MPPSLDMYDDSMHPVALFQEWFAEARAHPHITEPTAMTLATATAKGAPSARIVLLKEVLEEGFVFYSNQHSRKGGELADNPHAALCFYWMPLNKQVRIEGVVRVVEDAVADAYFASRGREKQLGAWASMQSRPMDSREDLQSRLAEMDAKFKGSDVPRPPHWSGWVLAPKRMEFWIQRDFRLHERVSFTKTAQDHWQHAVLYP